MLNKFTKELRYIERLESRLSLEVEDKSSLESLLRMVEDATIKTKKNAKNHTDLLTKHDNFDYEYDSTFECENLLITHHSQINKGCIYFAIKGDKFNGNDFIKDAIKCEAAFIITDEAITDEIKDGTQMQIEERNEKQIMHKNLQKETENKVKDIAIDTARDAVQNPQNPQNTQEVNTRLSSSTFNENIAPHRKDITQQSPINTKSKIILTKNVRKFLALTAALYYQRKVYHFILNSHSISISNAPHVPNTNEALNTASNSTFDLNNTSHTDLFSDTELNHNSNSINELDEQKVVGITGTNGKTSITYLYAQLAQAQGYNAATIGTLGCLLFPKAQPQPQQTPIQKTQLQTSPESKDPEYLQINYPQNQQQNQQQYNNSNTASNCKKESPLHCTISNCTEYKNYSSSNTTPDPVTLHKTLYELRKLGYSHIAIEVSSHALDQDRVAGLEFTTVGFSNLGRDHLDYHQNLKNYFDSKKKLFSNSYIKSNKVVLNKDIKEYEELKDLCLKNHLQIFEYGYNAKDEIWGEDLKRDDTVNNEKKNNIQDILDIQEVNGSSIKLLTQKQEQAQAQAPSQKQNLKLESKLHSELQSKINLNQIKSASESLDDSFASLQILSPLSSSSPLSISSLSSSFSGIIFKYSNQLYKIPHQNLMPIQQYNLLCAMGLAINSGLNFHLMANFIPNLTMPPGRLELITGPQGIKIYIDYAHTPDALESVLRIIKDELILNAEKNETQKNENENKDQNYYKNYRNKNHRKGDLYVLFGCGGNRDKKKRFEMGRIAYDIADVVIITDDNPRFEDPSHIRRDIIQGCKGSNKFIMSKKNLHTDTDIETHNLYNIDGRSKAITYAINLLKPNDRLIIAGKGHEDYQILQNKKVYFSDSAIVKNLIGNMKMKTRPMNEGKINEAG